MGEAAIHQVNHVRGGPHGPHKGRPRVLTALMGDPAAPLPAFLLSSLSFPMVFPGPAGVIVKHHF